ncbi:MAG: hypothetical protein IPG50_06250, partial [Myxococcales bacterium]|nr:hypothetical protein [Myxococcales bacterium]
MQRTAQATEQLAQAAERGAWAQKRAASSGAAAAGAMGDISRYMGRIGSALTSLDRGFAEGLKVQRATLASIRHIEATQQQVLAAQRRQTEILNQLRAMQAQANELARMQLHAQLHQLQVARQQLEMQHQQLDVQLQQLHVAEQQWAAQLEREEREARENMALRCFVDMHEGAKQGHYARASFEAFLTIVASERVYAQLYTTSETAANRLTLSSIRDKNLEILGELLTGEESRAKIRDAYVALFVALLPLVHQAREIRGRFDQMHQAYGGSVFVALEPGAFATVAQTSPYRQVAASEEDVLATCEENTALYETDMRLLVGELEGVLRQREQSFDNVRLGELALVPRHLGGAEGLRRHEAAVTEFRRALDEALQEPFDMFVAEFERMFHDVGGRVQEGQRLLDLAARTKRLQSFVR